MVTHFVHGMQGEDVHRYLDRTIERYREKDDKRQKRDGTTLTPRVPLHVMAQLVKYAPRADRLQSLAVEQEAVGLRIAHVHFGDNRIAAV